MDCENVNITAEIRVRVVRGVDGEPTDVVVDCVGPRGEVSSTCLRELLAEYAAADELRDRCAAPWADHRQSIPLAPIVLLDPDGRPETGRGTVS